MKASASHLGMAAMLAFLPLICMQTVLAADLDCKLDYEMKGWSAIYSTAQGLGNVVCSDGSVAAVALDATGAGLTAGKSNIDDGHGSFVGVHRIRDIFGDYAAASASGGAVRSGETAVVTKGDVTLTLKGTGTGWNAGVGFSRFSIKPAAVAH